MSGKPRVIIVGGGLAGLACAMRLAEDGVLVDLFSIVPVTQSHSVTEQDGINACNNITRQSGDSEWVHLDETILGGDFLADQPPVHEMCIWGPRIVHLLDRMGVPFGRTAEGRLATRLSSGSLYSRTFYSGATTGQQALYALDQQVRRHEAAGFVRKFENWEFLSPLLHEGACCGITAQDLRSMRIDAFPADAVVIASGGSGQIFANSSMSLACTGAAVCRCYQAGAKLGNPEFVQFHPTAIAGEGKSRVIGEYVRADGGRLWTPAVKENGAWKPHPAAARGPAGIGEAERYYFLQEAHAKYGDMVPADLAARQITQLCLDAFGGGDGVYLETSGEPTKVFPAVHASLGGLWVTFKKDEKTGGLRAGDPANLSTSIPGLYAVGQANYAYHGACALGGNTMLSCIFDGLFGGACVKSFCADLAGARPPSYVVQTALKVETDRAAELAGGSGGEDSHALRAELAAMMSEHCGVVRDNGGLEQSLGRCQEFKTRAANLRLTDSSSWANTSLPHVRATRDMILMAEAVSQAALLRNESRGGHFKPAYPDRDDANFLKATIVRYDRALSAPVIGYEPVDTSLIAPRPRLYGAKPAAAVVPKADKSVA